jgi:hypothetical protein
MKVENFSGGYFKTELRVSEYEDGPTMETETYSFINRQFYANSDGNPMFRFGLDGNPYFEVSAEVSIPADVIGVPREWLADNKIVDGSYQDVFILKPAHADILREARELSRRFPEK